MHDDVLAEFLERHKGKLRVGSALEKLRHGSNYFSLESRRKDDRLAYVMLRSSGGGNESELPISASELGKVLRGSVPFIPDLLAMCGKPDWAQEALAMPPPDVEPTFLYDALSLPTVQILLQFDWLDAKIPDGFKLGAKFAGEQGLTYFPLHNDVVATAVETGQSMLRLALQICPDVAKRLVAIEPDLKAKWEAAGLNEVAMPSPVPGRALRL